jgi:hypothetical protein
VNTTRGMHGGETIEELPDQADRSCRRDDSEVLQRWPVEQLHDEIELAIRGLVGEEHSYDVRVIDRADRPHFVAE